MANKRLGVVGVVVFGFLSFGAVAGQIFGPKPGDLLEGDARDACDIRLCLASLGVTYQECARALSIWENTKPSKRPALLDKCPMKEDEK